MSQKLKELAQQFRTTHNRNNQLMPLAHQCRRDGRTQAQAQDDIITLYGEVETPEKHDAHLKEVERAVEKAYSKTYSKPYVKPATPPMGSPIAKTELANWRRNQGYDPKLMSIIQKQDTAEKRTTTRQALKALFRNANGIVSQGKDVNNVRWMSIDDGFKSLDTAALYTTICTFQEATERKNENVDKIALMLLELDEPLDGEKKDTAKLGEAEKADYVKGILKDTCYILEAADLRPTTMTYSGGKSFHCLFRLAQPITIGEFNKALPQLKSAYTRIGADPATLTASRCTRMPRGCRQDEAEQGQCQRVMYLDESAEIDFSDYTAKLTKLADTIAPAPEPPQQKIPLPIYPKKDADGNIQKWLYNPDKWEAFLEAIGIEVLFSDYGNLLVRKEGNGVLTSLKPAEALKYIYDRLEKVGPGYKAHFAEKMSAALMADNLNRYMVRSRHINRPTDTKTSVYVPFKNGMLEITKDAATLHDGYMGYDILDSDPSTKRDWKENTAQKAEFETFLERACGMMEAAPEWERRKEAIMSMLGYLVSRTKEGNNNYINILIEETMTENDGGTGKSLIMQAVSYWRKRYLKDLKNFKSGERFIWSGLQPYTDYMQLDDAPKNLDIERFFTLATGGMAVEKKGQDEFTIPIEKAPKITMGTNRFIKGNGGSFWRRIKWYELSNHYKATGAVLTPLMEFGHFLYNDWNDEEWNRFDNFLVKCTQLYIEKGLVECPVTSMGEKSLSANMPDELVEFYKENIENHRGQYYPIADIIKDYRRWYSDQYGHNPDDYSSKYMAEKTREYCQVEGIETQTLQKKIAGQNRKCIYIANIGEALGNSATDASTTADPTATDATDKPDEEMPF